MRHRQFDRPILVAIVIIWGSALLLLAFTLRGPGAKSAVAPAGVPLEQTLLTPTLAPAALAPGATDTAPTPSPVTATMPAKATPTPAATATSAPSFRGASGGGADDPPAPPTVPLPPLPLLVDRVDDAGVALRSAQLTVVIDYGGGASAIVRAQCQLDAARRVQALQLATVYRAATGERADERILIGTQAWVRQATGWAEAPPDDGLRAQFLAYLPHPGGGVGLSATPAPGGAELRYYDPARDADTILTVDPATGRPATMRQQERRSGTVTSVTYTGWDTAVQIDPPPLDTPVP